MDSWIGFFKHVLETPGGPEFETLTDDKAEIEKLDSSPFWKLKGIVANITKKLE